MKSAHPHLQLVPPPVEVTIRERPVPWWEAPEFQALSEVRRAMVAEGVPTRTGPLTAEESARHAVFWALFEVEHLVRTFAARVDAGEAVRIRSAVYKHQEGRVDFDLRIVDHVEILGGLP